MKVFSIMFAFIAVLLSHAMCAAAAFAYRGMLCGIAHGGYSAPASTAFITALPYAIGAVVCAVLSIVFWTQAKKRMRG